jgi:lysophospholipase L1-like esterase
MNWRWGVGRNIWKKYYADRAVDCGQSWDRTQNALWRVENLDIKDLKPKVAVIMIGTNNDHDTPQDIAAGVKSVADATTADFPGIKIIFVSILPNGRAPLPMAAANAIIQGFADNQTTYYLDLASSFTPVGNNWKGLGIDRLHPTEEGYVMWADALNPLLAKVLGAGDAASR